MKRESLNPNFERLRILGALGIVTFHTQTGWLKEVGYIGLPLFLLLTALLQVGGKPGSFGAQAKKKALRFLLPWAGWVGLYLLADVALAVARHQPVSQAWATFNPFFGTRLHLWYLTFAFGAWAVTRALEPLWPKAAPAVKGTVLATGALLVLFVASWQQGCAQAPEPLPQWVFALPGWLWGLALGHWRQASPRALAWGGVGSWLLLMVGGVCFRAAGPALETSLLTYGVAVPLVTLACLKPDTPSDRWTNWLAPLTYGIYLSHPLTMLVLYRIPGFRLENPWQGVLVLFLASALLVAALRRTALRVFS